MLPLGTFLAPSMYLGGSAASATASQLTEQTAQSGANLQATSPHQPHPGSCTAVDTSTTHMRLYSLLHTLAGPCYTGVLLPNASLTHLSLITRLTTGAMNEASKVVTLRGAIRPSHCCVRSCRPSGLSCQVWRVVATTRLQAQVATPQKHVGQLQLRPRWGVIHLNHMAIAGCLVANPVRTDHDIHRLWGERLGWHLCC